MKRCVVIAAIAVSAVVSMPAAAHDHSVSNHRNQVLANSMNHPDFAGSVGAKMSCETNTLPADFGPAWYGLEVAHHGPDASGQGKGDGCYMLEGGILPSEDTDINPAFNP